MKVLRSRKVLLIAAIVVLAIVGLVRLTFTPFGLGIALRTQGLTLGEGSWHLGLQRTRADHAVILSQGGKPLFTADHLDASYDLGSLLRGGPHAFSLQLDRPVLLLKRNADGTWNAPLGKGSTPSATPAASGLLPPHLTAHVRIADGTIRIAQPQLLDPNARTLTLDHLALSADVDSDATTSYRLSAAIDGHPLRAQGGIDAKRGLAVHRLEAEHLPLAVPVNALLNTSAFVLQSGSVDGLRVDAYGDGKPGTAPLGDRIVARGSLHGVAARIVGLAQPLRDVDATLLATEDTLSLTDVTGNLAGAALAARADVFHFVDPQLRIAATGAGDLTQIRRLFPFSAGLPLSGPLKLAATVEGRASSPTVLVDVRDGDLHYAKIPFTIPQGGVVYTAGGVDLAPVDLRYGDIALHASGTIEVGDHVRPDLVMHAAAPTAALPYLDGLFGGRSEALVLLGGQDTALDGRGYISGSDGNRSMRGLAHLDGTGAGIVGPLVLEEDGRTRLLAGGLLERPRQVFLGAIAAESLRVRPSTASLPGLSLPAVPAVAGELGGSLGVGGNYRRLIADGDLHMRALTYNGRPAADRAELRFGGDSRLLDLDRAQVTGDFGNIDLAGQVGLGGLALHGRVRGDLASIGRTVGIANLAGTVDMPLIAQGDGKRVAVQIPEAATRSVSVYGVAVDGFSLDALSSPGDLALAAHTNIAGGDVLAAGDSVHGIGVSAQGVGLPAAYGGASVSAAALVRQTADGVRAEGTVLAEHAELQGLEADALTGFTADAQNLKVQGGLVRLPGALARLDGTISKLSGERALDLHAQIIQASVADLTEQLSPASMSLYPRGSVTADLHVGGNAAAPSVTGDVAMVEGSINGLAFHDAKTRVDASGKNVRLRHGRVGVGGTDLHVGGAYDGKGFRSYVNAQHADLADFNNFFDQNNMLAGSGKIRVTAAAGTDKVRSLADIDLHDVRVGNILLGTTQARWHSRGGEISGEAGVNGVSGRLAITGGLQLAEHRTSKNFLSRSRLDLRGSASDLDLRRWLPALGINAPVTGRLDISGRAQGLLPRVDGDLRIDAREAAVGPFPIDEAKAHLVSRNGRGIVERASLVVKGASADASGTFGFAPSDPIALALHAQSPRIGDFAASIADALRSDRADTVGLGNAATQTDRRLAQLQPLDGALSTSLDIKGTTAKPRISGAVDLENAKLRGLPIPRVLASFAVEGKKFNLTDAEIAFTQGSVTMSGSLPLVLSPFSIGPAAAPLSLAGTANAIDLQSFAPLLPAKSELHGMIDGAIALEGTPASPALFGELDLRGGSFVSPVETVPIRKAEGSLRLAGRTATLASAATVGGGVFSLNGSASVENLTALGHHTDYKLQALAKHAQFDLASYGRGTLDADVRISHVDTQPPHVDGTVALTDAQIPFSALYNPSAPATSAPESLLTQTVLNLRLIAGKNSRVRSGSIDLGATGTALLAGTVGHPTLDGAFTSTGGSITYFNRSFRVASGRVAFDPDDGIKPQINAEATTTASASTRTSTGGGDRVAITLTVAGTPDHVAIGLHSEPSYSREQILGLLLNVPLLGASTLAQSGSGDVGGLQVAGANNGGSQVNLSQEAFNIVNAQFSQSLLAPISNALGDAVGLSDLAVNFDQSGNIDFSARRHIFGNVYAFFRDSFGIPQRQSLGVDFAPNEATAVSASIFQEQGSSVLGRTGNSSLFTPQQGFSGTSYAANGGAIRSGVSFSFNRRFP